MVTEGSYTDGKRWIMYRLVESLCHIPKTKVTLCVNYTTIKNVLLPFRNIIFIKLCKYILI